jgi:hypothetical protein
MGLEIVSTNVPGLISHEEFSLIGVEDYAVDGLLITRE